MGEIRPMEQTKINVNQWHNDALDIPESRILKDYCFIGNTSD